MFKKILILGILTVVLVGVINPTSVYADAKTDCTGRGGQWADANTDDGGSCIEKDGRTTQSGGWSMSNISAAGNFIIEGFAKFIGSLLMTTSAAILGIVGFLFDLVVDYTIINMTTNIGDPTGVGGSITSAWATLRDVANMFFIFVLLYTAFKAMFELNFANVGKTITNIIIVALLINFSLFFSKVVIDASNIVSVGFYQSIVESNSTSGVPSDGTISKGYMKLLGLQSWYDPAILKDSFMNGGQLLIVGIMSSIFMLVVAVILLISAIMFIARFIILIFLMILSPLALIAYIVPAMKDQFTKWLQALIDQSFFAPLFFALTWIVFKLTTSPKFLGLTLFGGTTPYIDIVTKAPTPSSMSLVLNYVLVIGFSIAALVFSKTMASKTAGFSAISGGIISGASALSRNTIGRASKVAADSTWLKNKAQTSKFARVGLWTASKGAKGSFDIRGMGDTKLGKAVNGGEMFKGMGSAGGKGGFDKAVKDKAEEKARYAKEVYGETLDDKAKDKREKERLAQEIEDAKGKEEEEIEKTRKVTAENVNSQYELAKYGEEFHEKEVLKPELDDLADLKKQRKTKEAELKTARTNGVPIHIIEKLEKESASLSRSIEIQNEEINDKRKNMQESDASYIEKKNRTEEMKKKRDEANKLKNAKIKEAEYSDTLREKIEKHKNFVGSANERQQKYAKRVGSGVFGWTAGNQAARRKIEEQVKEPSKEKKFADAAKALAKEEEENKKKESESKETKTEEPKKDDGTGSGGTKVS